MFNGAKKDQKFFPTMVANDVAEMSVATILANIMFIRIKKLVTLYFTMPLLLNTIVFTINDA